MALIPQNPLTETPLTTAQLSGKDRLLLVDIDGADAAAKVAVTEVDELIGRVGGALVRDRLQALEGADKVSGAVLREQTVPASALVTAPPAIASDDDFATGTSTDLAASVQQVRSSQIGPTLPWGVALATHRASAAAVAALGDYHVAGWGTAGAVITAMVSTADADRLRSLPWQSHVSLDLPKRPVANVWKIGAGPAVVGGKVTITATRLGFSTGPHTFLGPEAVDDEWAAGTSYAAGAKVFVSGLLDPSYHACILANTGASANNPVSGADKATYWTAYEPYAGDKARLQAAPHGALGELLEFHEGRVRLKWPASKLTALADDDELLARDTAAAAYGAITTDSLGLALRPARLREKTLAGYVYSSSSSGLGAGQVHVGAAAAVIRGTAADRAELEALAKPDLHMRIERDDDTWVSFIIASVVVTGAGDASFLIVTWGSSDSSGSFANLDALTVRTLSAHPDWSDVEQSAALSGDYTRIPSSQTVASALAGIGAAAFRAAFTTEFGFPDYVLTKAAVVKSGQWTAAAALRVSAFPALAGGAELVTCRSDGSHEFTSFFEHMSNAARELQRFPIGLWKDADNYGAYVCEPDVSATGDPGGAAVTLKAHAYLEHLSRGGLGAPAAGDDIQILFQSIGSAELQAPDIQVGARIGVHSAFGTSALADNTLAGGSLALDTGAAAKGYRAASDGQLEYGNLLPPKGACGVLAVPWIAATGHAWDRRQYLRHSAYRTVEVDVECHPTAATATVEMRYGRGIVPAAWAAGAQALGAEVSSRTRWYECIRAHTAAAGNSADGQPYQSAQTGWAEIPRRRRYAVFGTGDSLPDGQELHYFTALTAVPTIYQLNISDGDTTSYASGSFLALEWEEDDIVDDYAQIADSYANRIYLPDWAYWLLKPWIRPDDNTGAVSGGLGANTTLNDSDVADFGWQSQSDDSGASTQRTIFRHPGIERYFNRGDAIRPYVFFNAAESTSKWGIYVRRLSS